jgi:hypothetical protein
MPVQSNRTAQFVLCSIVSHIQHTSIPHKTAACSGIKLPITGCTLPQCKRQHQTATVVAIATTVGNQAAPSKCQQRGVNTLQSLSAGHGECASGQHQQQQQQHPGLSYVLGFQHVQLHTNAHSACRPLNNCRQPHAATTSHLSTAQNGQ